MWNCVKTIQFEHFNFLNYGCKTFSKHVLLFSGKFKLTLAPGPNAETRGLKTKGLKLLSSHNCIMHFSEFIRAGSLRCIRRGPLEPYLKFQLSHYNEIGALYLAQRPSSVNLMLTLRRPKSISYCSKKKVKHQGKQFI